MSASNVLATKDFFARIEKGNFSPPTILKGMVKVSKDDHEFFHFAPVGKCGSWLKIPRAMVAEGKILGEAPCNDDHSHARVEFRLAEPQTDAEATLRGLLNLVSATKGE